MANSVPSFTVFYIPLNIDYVVPPTPQYLEDHGLKIQNLSSVELIKLFEDVDRNSGVPDNTYEHKMIRIKIINNQSKKEIYITQNKIILVQDETIQMGWKLFNIDKNVVNAALIVIVKAACSYAKSKFYCTP